MISGTVFESGTTLLGQAPEAFYTSIAHFPSLSVGFNCGVGPAQMKPHLKTLSDMAARYITCYPNAGMPDGMGGYKPAQSDFKPVIR